MQQRRFSRSGNRFHNRSRSGRRSGGQRKFSIFNPSQYINKNPIETSEETYNPKHTFADFGFNEKVNKSLEIQGIVYPSPIQDQTIPMIMEGRDVVGLAETGTGKTAAFLLPLIEKTFQDPKQMTLIMAPTRELAMQINDELRKFVKGLKIYSTVCVGGASIRPQLASLRMLNHFIIGTPGRILDHIERGTIKPQYMQNVVLDEADRMLDMGFVHDMKKIMNMMPKDRQTLFFSATTNDSTNKIIKEFLTNPVEISVKKKDIAKSIAQDVVPFRKEEKFNKLMEILSSEEFARVIIFGEMKHAVQKLSDDLSKGGITADAIHGNKSHSQRQRALKSFKEGKVRVLVATDVAARGIHVDKVSHVINYDLPQTFEDYTHRIGRTGRGAEKGQALTFVPERY